MKKILLLLLIPAILSACTNRDKKKDENHDIASSEVVPNDNHNASNSLSYGGTYEGVIPGADSSDMDVVITLDYDGNYTKKFTPKEDKTANVSASTGKFIWDETGFVITLNEEGDGEKFMVVEGAIIMLDKNGKERTGDSAEKYRLEQTSLLD